MFAFGFLLRRSCFVRAENAFQQNLKWVWNLLWICTVCFTWARWNRLLWFVKSRRKIKMKRKHRETNIHEGTRDQLDSVFCTKKCQILQVFLPWKWPSDWCYSANSKAQFPEPVTSLLWENQKFEQNNQVLKFFMFGGELLILISKVPFLCHSETNVFGKTNLKRILCSLIAFWLRRPFNQTICCSLRQGKDEGNWIQKN